MWSRVALVAFMVALAACVPTEEYDNITLVARNHYELSAELELEVGPCLDSRNGIKVNGRYTHGGVFLTK